MIGCLIVARLSSKRLPNKNVLLFNGVPMIVNLYNRIKKSKTIDKIIICTSNEPSDDPLESIAIKNNILIYRGSLDNIMERIVSCAFEFNLTDIVEILGDNPLVDNTLVDFVTNHYLVNNLDYCTNISLDYKKQLSTKTYSCFPVGLRVQIYNTSIASNYKKYKNDSFVSSHPTNFIFENNHIYKNHFLEANDVWRFLNLENLTFAVNEQYQFNCIRDIFENFKSFDFSLKQMINFINKRKINFKI